MIYTDDFLTDLINCPKLFLTPPRKELLQHDLFLRDDFKLTSVDKKNTFLIFIRKSTEFMEDFSIGLRWEIIDEAGTIPLFRCNGKHGGTKVHPHHVYCHIHKSRSEDLNNGIKKERHITEAIA